MLTSIKDAGPSITEINEEAERIGRDVGTVEAALGHEDIRIRAEVYLDVEALKIDGSTATAAGLVSSLYLLYGKTKDHGWCILLKTSGSHPVPFKEASRGLRLLSKRLLPMLVKQIQVEILLQKRMIQPDDKTPTP